MTNKRILPILLLTLPSFAQGPCGLRHLAIFDANLAQFTEERTLQLQPGLNNVEWRSLMPQAILGTLRVSGEQATVSRQDVTFDGGDVRGQKSPVLHLALQSASAGARQISVDYLAPKVSWKSDYSLVLGPPVHGAPAEMLLDGWVSVQNDTGADICADSVDLIAGEVQLLAGTGSGARDFTTNSQISYRAEEAGDPSTIGITGMSVFSRLALGRDLTFPANVSVDRFPLLQRLNLPVEQRNIFENDARTQTLGRGGFMLAPRGLEVRLVSKNNSPSPLPAGAVTIYSPEGGFSQVVGQDRIPLTPAGADFSVTQGRSNVLQGTRRIADRREVTDSTARSHNKLVTRIEVTISNRGSDPATAFVREGTETWGGGEWTVTESTHPHQKLGDHMMEFKIAVPAKSSVKLEYTVEIR